MGEHKKKRNNADFLPVLQIAVIYLKQSGQRANEENNSQHNRCNARKHFIGDIQIIIPAATEQIHGKKQEQRRRDR